MKFNTIEEATKAWVGEMNAIPSALLQKAYSEDMDELEELTPLKMKWECDACGEEFNQEEIDKLLEIEHVDNDDNIICPTCYKDDTKSFKEENKNRDEGFMLDLNDCSAWIEKVEDYDSREYGLPMWGWLWNPLSIDEAWIKDNLEIVAECGFRIYESDEVGVFIGVDGAGYDFYEAHWIPLYKARGLKWHNTTFIKTTKSYYGNPDV